MIGVSSGTASVLGLRRCTCDVLPETAYLMLGEGCSGTCRFCAQSMLSKRSSRHLSRITWPLFESEIVIERLASASEDRKFRRICFQMVNSEGVFRKAKDIIRTLKKTCALPVGISSNSLGRSEIDWLFEEEMIDSLALPLDAAAPGVFREVKGEGWEYHMSLLLWAAEKYRHKIATHLVVGIGETEEEMVRMMEYLYDRGVRVGLFAFTPLRGTPLAGKKPPSLDLYRRLQAVHFVIARGLPRAYEVREGRAHFLEDMVQVLIHESGGTPFQTSGCPGCNRPYYNERPGGTTYNFPRALTEEEVHEAYRMIYKRGEQE
jgi:lipoyl synthase